MNAMQSLLQHPVAERLGWSLIHLLWQGVILALLLVGCLWLLRRRSANARYLAAGVTLLLMPVSLAVTFAVLTANRSSDRADDSSAAFILRDGPRAAATKGIARADSNSLVRVAHASAVQSNPNSTLNGEPSDTKTSGHALKGSSVAVSSTAHVNDPGENSDDLNRAAESRSESLQSRSVQTIESALPGIVGGWLLGMFGLSVWNVGGWVALQRLRVRGVSPVSDTVLAMMNRLRSRMEIRQHVEILQTSRIPVPSVMGFLKPVILIPGSVMTGLFPSQLEAILAHELAHIRRHDYLVNLVQTGIEMLLFFHPAVWWISRRVRIERENCCDDIALAVTENRLLYAQSLTLLEELRQQTAARPAGLTVAASGGSLLDRICRVLGRPRRLAVRSRFRSIGTTGLSGILTLAAVLLFVLPGMFVPSVAVSAKTADETTAVPSEESQTPTLLSEKKDGEKPKSTAEPIDLGKDMFRVEINPPDKVPGGLYAIGSYRVAGQAPDAKTLYAWRLAKTATEGNLELVGRVPGVVSNACVFQTVSFRRTGKTISATIGCLSTTVSERDSRSLYIRGKLPQRNGRSTLPPGTYDVRVEFVNAQAVTGKAKLPAKEKKGLVIKPVTCRFVVPKKTSANATAEKATEWHPLIKGKMATVSVAKSLYEKQSEKHFLTRVRVTNRTDREIGVDLMDRRYGVRLNQWGVFSLPERGVIDETRIERKPFQAADKAKLIAAFRAGTLLRIPAGKSIEFYCPFNGTDKASVRKTIEAAKGKFLILSMDGEVRVTDGKGCEVVGCGEPGDADVVVPRPVSWKKVPGDARILGEEQAGNEGKAISPAKWNPRADRRLKPDAYEKNTTAKFTKRDELIRSLPLENMPAGDIRFPLSQWFEQSQKANVAVATSENNWLLFRSKQVDDQEKMWITSIKRAKNTFTIRMTRSVWLGDYTRNTRYHDVFGVNLGKLPVGKYKAKWIIDRASHMHFDKDGWPTDGGVVKKNTVELSVGFSVVPPRKTAATNDAPKDQFRFLVIQGHVKFPKLQKVAIDRNVKVGVPFDLRPRDGLRAKGLLKRTQTGELRFKGHVSMFTTSGPVEGPVKLGRPVSPNGLGFGSIIIPFFVRFERPKPAKTSKAVLKAIKSPKERGTLRDAYQKKRRRKAATRDELLSARLPLYPIYQYIDLDGWFDLNKKTKPTPRTNDGDHWLMFRSQPLNDNDREWIERVERSGNRFTITLQRGIWDGDYAENQMFHDVFGLNLGKLKPGKYTVTWIIRESHFTEFDKDRWPKNGKPTKSTELKTSFTVAPARKNTR